MIDDIRMAKYIIAMTHDLNSKLDYVYKDIYVRRKTKEPTIFVSSEGFENETEIDLYYAFKVYQVLNVFKNLKEADKILAFTSADDCKVVFRDTIKDDSGFEEFLNRRKNNVYRS